jgi:biotin transport system substrate-specific component
MSVNTLTLKKDQLLSNLLIVLLSSLLLGLLGHLSIPLPFTPVPIAIQCQACLLLGALLGARRAAAAVFLFLVQGALGLPVFAHGTAGLAKLIGPTGGYLIGYLAAAYVVGALFERTRELTPLKMFWAITLGNGVVFLLGAGYLSLYLGISNALLLGVAPFLLGDVLKNIACVKILQWWKSRLRGRV